MPQGTRKIKYHPAADLTKASIILKFAYINILQNIKNAIRKSNLTRSTRELTKTAHSCQIKLRNTLKHLKKDPNLVKQHIQLTEFLIKSLQFSPTPQELLEGSSFEKQLDYYLKTLPRMPNPSRTFFKHIQDFDHLLEKQDSLYKATMHFQKSIQPIERLLKSKTIHPALKDLLNELLPSLKRYSDSVVKFSKLIKPSKRLKTTLKNANKLKNIFEDHEKGEV